MNQKRVLASHVDGTYGLFAGLGACTASDGSIPASDGSILPGLGACTASDGSCLPVLLETSNLDGSKGKGKSQAASDGSKGKGKGKASEGSKGKGKGKASDGQTQ